MHTGSSITFPKALKARALLRKKDSEDAKLKFHRSRLTYTSQECSLKKTTGTVKKKREKEKKRVCVCVYVFVLVLAIGVFPSNEGALP